jgi:hypothetical protein
MPLVFFCGEKRALSGEAGRSRSGARRGVLLTQLQIGHREGCREAGGGGGGAQSDDMSVSSGDSIA